MNENINLCEILKGHEGETFYSKAHGNVKFEKTQEFNGIKQIRCSYISPIKDNNYYCIFLQNGKIEDMGECMLFPSKDQRDWNKWIEEQKSKTPKTWSKLVKDYNTPDLYVNINDDGTDICCGSSPIEKSALALLKIHQLIEVGYGGNISNEEWKDNNIEKICIYTSIWTNNCFNYEIYTDYKFKCHIAFHTEKQTKEFLSYEENVQLLKDYFMI